MYSELLSAMVLNTDSSEQPPSQPELVATLIQCRGRLRRRKGERECSIAQDLALELDHDRNLLRLCGALGIEMSPEAFVEPIPERRRLEEALRDRGIELDSFEDELYLRAQAV